MVSARDRGGADPGGSAVALERHLRSLARRAPRGGAAGSRRSPPARPCLWASRRDGADAPGHPGHQPGTLAAAWRRCFIHSPDVCRALRLRQAWCQALGLSRRIGGDLALWGSSSKREVWLEGDL